MSYDGLDRLSTANGAWGNGSFSYDVLSNIKTKTVAGTTYSYTYDTTKNRLASVTGGYSFGYDDRGNVTNNGKRGFSFNRANQLVQSASVSYVYDGYNRRVRQSNASGNHYSVYDAKGTLKQRLTSANARVYSVYLGKQLIAERELSASSNTTRYQHTDVLGSVVGESDSAAALTRSVYQPFGERLGGQKSGVGFTGHLEDPDVGLTYMQARYYDPVIGRFYSNDPIGFSTDSPMTFNRYAYANNNPYKFIDPSGESNILALTPMKNYNTPPQSEEAGKAGGDFVKNYKSMRDANTIGADKFFHCKANCEATLRGEVGEKVAEVISDTREWADQNIKGDPASASDDDQKANQLGRDQGKNIRENNSQKNDTSPKACSDACSTLKPQSLDKEYEK